MNILVPDEVEDLRLAARRLLAPHTPTELRSLDQPTRDGVAASIWSQLTTEMGLLEIAAADEGLFDDGGPFVAMAVVAEELGRFLAPVPLVQAMIACWTIATSGRPEAIDLLPALISGESIPTVALGESENLEAPALRAEGGDGGWTVSGTASLLMAGDLADVFVVPAVSDGSTLLFAVRRDGSTVVTTATANLDETRPLARATFDRSEAVLIADAVEAPQLIARTFDLGALLFAAESSGGARRTLETTLEYLRYREQFGRPLGSFQALKHRLADDYVALEGAASLVALAAAIGDDPSASDVDFRVAASAAKSHTTDTYCRIAADAVQFHGGIGFTWEHETHLYFKRAHVVARLWGSADAHRERIAAALTGA